MLTKRLRKLIDAIPRCNVLADVGCDHGYVGIEALKRGVAQAVVFSDISSACLDKARTNCPAALYSRATFVCRDGLGDTVCDAAAICGMGGLEILSILKGAKRLPGAVVLQPMRNIVDVRNYVADNYQITLDVTVSDGKFYTVIAGENAGAQTRKMTDCEEAFGITNMQGGNADFELYLQNERTKLTKILCRCNDRETAKRLELVNKATEQIGGYYDSTGNAGISND